MSITIEGGIDIGGGITVSQELGSFTITSTDILGSGSAIYLNTTPIGTNGRDGFTNTGPDDLYVGYYAQNLDSAIVTIITNYLTALGISPTNSQGYVYNVTWGAGSSISSGLAKLGFYSGNGTPSNAYFDLQTIDPSITSWQNNNNASGTSLAGTFLFPATFTIYQPLTDKNGWC